MTQRFDLFVIGGGAAGGTAAGIGIRRGLRVGQAEQWKIGGTCLNTGCDPTKTIIRSAQVLHLACTSDRFGLRVRDPHPDWPAIRARVHQVIDTIRGGDGDQNVRDSGITLYKQHARFRDAHTIEIQSDDPLTVEADQIVIATGATEAVPDIPGLAEAGYLTNVDVPDLEELPRSLAIIGGGPVAVEFAQMFSRLGVDVSLIGSSSHILPKDDPDLAQELERILRQEGIHIETGTRVTAVRTEGSRHCLIGERSDSAEADIELCRVERILLAAGRNPVVKNLGLEHAGVEFDLKSGITVDDTLRTTAPNIWAAGDCTGTFPFTHYADYQGEIAGHNAAGCSPLLRADNHVVPWVTFTDPEMAHVGLTEHEAREKGHKVGVATFNMAELPRAIDVNERHGSVKLIYDRDSGKLYGGHILAAHAGEMLAEVVLAMRRNLPISALSDSIHSYPTMSAAVGFAADNAEVSGS